jgi:hypothetical protein
VRRNNTNEDNDNLEENWRWDGLGFVLGDI